MHPDSLRELYASKTDDELFQLAAEKGSLVESAQLALSDEIRRRNLDDSQVFTTTESSTKDDPQSESKSSLEKPRALRWMGFFLLNTFLVYMCAHFSRILVGKWLPMIANAFSSPIYGSPWDWYLRHLELVSIPPALAAGYFDIGRFLPATIGRRIGEWRSGAAGTWAWIVPTFLLLYKMAIFRAPSSVLVGTSMSTFSYFFDIQKVMPTLENPLVSDPVRVLRQLYLTAPFYAGVAFSMGALVWKRRLLSRFFKSFS